MQLRILARRIDWSKPVVFRHTYAKIVALSGSAVERTPRVPRAISVLGQFWECSQGRLRGTGLPRGGSRGRGRREEGRGSRVGRGMGGRRSRGEGGKGLLLTLLKVK